MLERDMAVVVKHAFIGCKFGQACQQDLGPFDNGLRYILVHEKLGMTRIKISRRKYLGFGAGLGNLAIRKGRIDAKRRSPHRYADHALAPGNEKTALSLRPGANYVPAFQAHEEGLSGSLLVYVIVSPKVGVIL